ncbi:5'-methylthioadenosine/S-adenosylhomocysteine nucleosidase family protein [Micromonospora sp. WMMC250]|uniref:5'-methylthioadenosine/S-adenosylhomocysteine nucleosidase family protein n=1 Tax=Micromonospora sp. WMMC250 TaxID=3014781 RepID=UPI0022B611DC|nr:phosphorylase [Micromonospora sp. WMMC250]MCZ7375271.1 phosphorylase [Micromonospora sp. WMMC250]
MPTVVFLTALDLEHAAVVEHLTQPTTERWKRGMIFDTGVFQGKALWHVAVAQAGPGNATAGILLDRAVTTFSPDVAMFVGIAGGRKDVRHGDVVVADAVYDYESGKDEEHLYLPRVKTSAPSFGLVQRAQAVVRRARWQERILPRPPTHRPTAFVKPIAAGGKVVANDRSSTARLLTAYCGDALAVDMESHGFLRGAYVNEGVSALVVRGISDLLSDKTAGNDARWQIPAARNAAAFAFEVLDAGIEPDQTGLVGADSHPAANSFVQKNSPAGGTVYANQGIGNQIIYPEARSEERHGSVRKH